MASSPSVSEDDSLLAGKLRRLQKKLEVTELEIQKLLKAPGSVRSRRLLHKATKLRESLRTQITRTTDAIASRMPISLWAQEDLIKTACWLEELAELSGDPDVVSDDERFSDFLRVVSDVHERGAVFGSLGQLFDFARDCPDEARVMLQQFGDVVQLALKEAAKEMLAQGEAELA
jgi:hypothetical protein